jgi:hypothetical protein
MDGGSTSPTEEQAMRRTVSIIALTLTLAVPATVWAADSFTDVPSSNVFHDDIAWLADAGVTKGCNPPDNTQFCPSDSVTREQMAAFMRRLAESGAVDAGTLDGEPASRYATVSAIGVCDDVAQSLDADSPLEPCPDPTFSGAVLTEVTIEAPAPGYLMLDWHATVRGGAPLIVGYLTDEATAGCANYNADIPGSIASTDLSTADRIDIGGVGRHPVEAGSNTVYLCGWAGTSAAVDFASVTALWTAG